MSEAPTPLAPGALGEATHPAPSSVLSKFRPTKVVIFGSGAYGTAVAFVLARRGHEVCLLTRKKEVEESVCKLHKNPSSALPDQVLPYNVSATTDPAKALAGASYVVHAIPVQHSFEYLAAIKELIPPAVPIINTSKGLHCATLQLMSDLIPAALGRTTNPVVVLSGPTFAAELIKSYPSGAVAACTDVAVAQEVAHLFESPTMRVWWSDDVIGVEVAGALKNVYAIAAGALEGLGLGYNTTALLCTRAIAEMTKLAVRLGGREATLAGLSGMGDMVLTCFGASSRNRSVGVRLGKGEPLADIMASMTEVAEGVATAPAALKLAQKHHVHAPIIEAVVAVLTGAVEAPLPALMALMSIPPGAEGSSLHASSFASALSHVAGTGGTAGGATTPDAFTNGSSSSSSSDAASGAASAGAAAKGGAGSAGGAGPAASSAPTAAADVAQRFAGLKVKSPAESE